MERVDMTGGGYEIHLISNEKGMIKGASGLFNLM